MSARQPQMTNRERLEYAKASARLDAKVKQISDQVNQIKDSWLDECFKRILPKDLWAKQEEAKLANTSHELRCKIYAEVQAYLHTNDFIVDFIKEENKYVLKQHGKVISEAQARVELPSLPGIIG